MMFDIIAQIADIAVTAITIYVDLLGSIHV
jgi:hypothetical protein